MAEYLTNTTDLATVADAIRNKGGISAPLAFPDGFATAIGNIPAGKTEQSKTLTLGANTPQTVTPDSGKALSSVPVTLDTSVIKAENIAKDVRMLGITGTHEGGGGRTASFVDITLPTPSSVQFVDIAQGNGMFVALASNGTIVYSSDGVNWASITLPSVAWKSIAYGNGKFVAVSRISSAYSVDGINWTSISLPTSEFREHVIYGGGKFVSLFRLNVDEPKKSEYSIDGINWEVGENILDNSGAPDVLIYDEGKFIALGNSFEWHSTDGINWDVYSQPWGNWRGVAYGNGIFVGIKQTEDDSIVFWRSIDGMSWTEVTPPVNANWFSIVYGNGTFIALANNCAAYSTDGSNWSTASLPSSVFRSASVYGGGKFVAMPFFGSNKAAYCDTRCTIV